MEHYYSYIVCTEDDKGLYGGDDNFKNKLEVKESILNYVKNNLKYGAIRILPDGKVIYKNNITCVIQIYRLKENADVHKYYIDVMNFDPTDKKVYVGNTDNGEKVHAERIEYVDFF